jgi:asparagine synthase (glutamine-hydrolysing)
LRKTVQDRLTSGAVPDSGMFDNERVRTIVEQHMHGIRDYSAPIWALLVFANFLQTHA